MASFWKKLNKKFLTLLLMIGVFFAGCLGINVSHSASAAFQDTHVGTTLLNNTAMYLTYTDNHLIGVDINGQVYSAELGETTLTKTGVAIGKIVPVDYVGLYNASFANTQGSFIAYKSGTIAAASYDGTDTFIYYSTNEGQSWQQVNLGRIGQPITLITGGTSFVLETQFNDNQAISIYSSQDGKSWTHCDNFGYIDPVADRDLINVSMVDPTMNYNNGYFVRTSSAYYTEDQNIKIYISVDLKNWTTINAPFEAYKDGQIYYYHTTAFMLNNQLYCLQDSTLFRKDILTNSASWQEITIEYPTLINKMLPYNNGFIACSDTQILYHEIDGEEISTTILSDAGYITTWEYADGADTIVFNDSHLTVGFSGSAGYIAKEDRCKTPYFTTFDRYRVFTVDFVDYNGNIINSVEVNDGECVIAPANPTREGYTFTGWDYDLTQPITADTTITAQYERNSCTVYFVDYNGQTIKVLTVPYGEQIPAEEIPTPARDGHTFIGWDNSTNQLVVSDMTFVAQYSTRATLKITYPGAVGTFGLEDQFIKTSYVTKIFTYTVGDAIESSDYLIWYNKDLLPWINDFEADNDYDYDVKFTGWDTTLPTYITNNMEVSINYEKLNLVRLQYYSQLRFNAYEQDGVDYYLTFVGFMNVERLIPTGTVLNLEDFKDPEVDYEIYNASLNSFYNNLQHFDFTGWSYNITKPITQDETIVAQYKMPTIRVKMFDLDGYLFNEEDQPVSFMTIEDFQAMTGNSEVWGRICEGFRLFFTLQWGELGDTIADQVDFTNYLNNVKQYHKKSRQILTGYVTVDTNNPDIYGGVFQYGSIEVVSEALQYYSGTARENNLSYWINPIVFSTTAYQLTVAVDYNTALGSAVKIAVNVGEWLGDAFSWLWDFITEYWWVIVIVVLLIIFRKPIIAGLTALVGLIKKATQKLSNKIKAKSKNSTYKKTEKEYTAVKKESKEKEK